MGTMKTSELTGVALDWAVAKCEELNYRIKEKDNLSKHIVVLQSVTCPDNKPGCCVAHYKVDYYTPSTNWSQGGPIIERMFRDGLEVRQGGPTDGNQRAWARLRYGKYYWHESSPLIAAMRCYVASKLGEEVEIPEELA